MKEIVSNGYSFLFVEVPEQIDHRHVVGYGIHSDKGNNNVLCAVMPQEASICFHGVPKDYTIHGTLKECLESEELAAEITEAISDEQKLEHHFCSYGRSAIDVMCATESLEAFFAYYSIDPTKHWIILKRKV